MCGCCSIVQTKRMVSNTASKATRMRARRQREEPETAGHGEGIRNGIAEGHEEEGGVRLIRVTRGEVSKPKRRVRMWRSYTSEKLH